MIAPELLIAESANILWKKVQRNELSEDEALLAARLLQAAEIDFLPTRSLLEAEAQIAMELNHAAYDCLYLALAADRDCRLSLPTRASCATSVKVTGAGFAGE